MEAVKINPFAPDSCVCKDCGEEKSIAHFKITRWGTRASVCNECATEKLRYNKEAKKVDQRKPVAPIADAEFDGKQPREVIEVMSRAKRWLESRGYEITLKGTYREVRVHTIKF